MHPLFEGVEREGERRKEVDNLPRCQLGASRFWGNPYAISVSYLRLANFF